MTLATGITLEKKAAIHLLALGVSILHSNFRCKYGEIDLIAEHDANLIFFEVRYRKNSLFGSATESVTLTKQQKIIRTAQFFLQTRAEAQQIPCRFDIISMTKNIASPQIEWIKDAFHA